MSTLGGLPDDADGAQPGAGTGGPTALGPVGRVRRAVLYPNLYAWYILAATLDVIVTHQILHHFQGTEVNKLADSLISRFGVAGMIGLKYASIIVVVLVCEFVGRRRYRLGRGLAIAAVCISSAPVGVGLLQLWAWSRTPDAGATIDTRIDDSDFPS